MVIGANVSNAFAEALDPKTSLYMNLDHQFRSWWKSKGKDPIQKRHGVKVLKAI